MDLKDFWDTLTPRKIHYEVLGNMKEKFRKTVVCFKHGTSPIVLFWQMINSLLNYF